MNPCFACELRPARKRLVMLIFLGLIGLVGCTSRDADDHTGDERYTSRSVSVGVTKRFLAVAAMGDSAALAAIARDTVVRTVLVDHRLHSTDHFRAAAETIRQTQVSQYTDGSDVTFRYVLGGVEHEAFVSLISEGSQLRVSAYGIPAKID